MSLPPNYTRVSCENIEQEIEKLFLIKWISSFSQFAPVRGPGEGKNSTSGTYQSGRQKQPAIRTKANCISRSYGVSASFVCECRGRVLIGVQLPAELEEVRNTFSMRVLENWKSALESGRPNKEEMQKRNWFLVVEDSFKHWPLTTFWNIHLYFTRMRSPRDSQSFPSTLYATHP